MARMARVVEAALQHLVTQPGNQRMGPFFCDDDNAAYLRFQELKCIVPRTPKGTFDLGEST